MEKIKMFYEQNKTLVIVLVSAIAVAGAWFYMKKR